MVSKSAQYCFTDRKNPVGFMLLSEVALGEVYELKAAKVSHYSGIAMAYCCYFIHSVCFPISLTTFFIFLFFFFWALLLMVFMVSLFGFHVVYGQTS